MLAVANVADPASAVQEFVAGPDVTSGVNINTAYAPEANLPDLFAAPPQSAAVQQNMPTAVPAAGQPAKGATPDPAEATTAAIAAPTVSASVEVSYAASDTAVRSLLPRADDQLHKTDELTLSLHGPQPPPAEQTELFQYSARPGNNDFVLRLRAGDGDWLELYDSVAGQVVVSRPLAEVDRVSIFGTDEGDDRLTVDLTAPFLIPGGVEYDGGDAWFDVLEIEGDSFSSTRYHALGPDSGTIWLDDLLISYRGLEPIVNTADPANVVIDATGGDDHLRLGLDPVVFGNIIVESRVGRRCSEAQRREALGRQALQRSAAPGGP